MGYKILYAWARDWVGNISSFASRSIDVLPMADFLWNRWAPFLTYGITYGNNTFVASNRTDAIVQTNLLNVAPKVSTFSIPAESTTLTVAITNFTVINNVGGTSYLITESSIRPAASDPDWHSIAPTSYTFETAGTKTLYAWAKDWAGDVSNSRSATVDIQILHGDINGNNIVDLKDTIIALRLLAGSNQSEIRSDYTISGTDVDGDNKITFSEVIFILQRVGGFR